MSTVRLSDKLLYDISKNAYKKFDNINPEKTYAEGLGDRIVQEFDLVSKANKALASVNSILEGVHEQKMYSYNQIELNAVEEYENEDDDYNRGKRHSYTLPLTTIQQAPGFLCKQRYSDTGYIKITVPFSNPILAECIAIAKHNDDLRIKRREFERNLMSTLANFTTLNQALKATDGAISDLVPQEYLDKSQKKEDRKARQIELAQIATDELKDLKEILLTDSLLGD